MSTVSEIDAACVLPSGRVACQPYEPIPHRLGDAEHDRRPHRARCDRADTDPDRREVASEREERRAIMVTPGLRTEMLSTTFQDVWVSLHTITPAAARGSRGQRSPSQPASGDTNEKLTTKIDCSSPASASDRATKS